MTDGQTDYGALIGALSKAAVDVIIIGGVAGNAHGSSRFTQDVDVVYSRDGDNVERMVRALRPLRPYPRGAPPGLPFDWSVATVSLGFNFTLLTTAGSLDLFGEIVGGGTYEDLLAQSVVMHVFDCDVRVLGLPALITVKRAAGRPKDFEALAELELLRELGTEHGGDGPAA